jgi:hypothetical protein
VRVQARGGDLEGEGEGERVRVGDVPRNASGETPCHAHGPLPTSLPSMASRTCGKLSCTSDGDGP